MNQCFFTYISLPLTVAAPSPVDRCSRSLLLFEESYSYVIHTPRTYIDRLLHLPTAGLLRGDQRLPDEPRAPLPRLLRCLVRAIKRGTAVDCLPSFPLGCFDSARRTLSTTHPRLALLGSSARALGCGLLQMGTCLAHVFTTLARHCVAIHTASDHVCLRRLLPRSFRKLRSLPRLNGAHNPEGPGGDCTRGSREGGEEGRGGGGWQKRGLRK